MNQSVCLIGREVNHINEERLAFVCLCGRYLEEIILLSISSKKFKYGILVKHQRSLISFN